jgi:hypothetical protein
MNELVRWLGEQLDEDERIARAVQWDGSGNRLSWELSASATIDVGEDEFYPGDRTIANHVVEHDPARVLREIDAKRELLRLAVAAHDYHETFLNGFAARMEGALRLFVLSYTRRPGYREEWRT